MAALQIPQFFTTEFATNWEFLAQQQDARLVGCVNSTTFQGKRKWFNQIGTGSMTEIVDRKGDTPDGDSTGFKYWIYRRAFEFVKVWGEDDQVQMENIALPTSDEVKSFTYAENRVKDAVIIQAFGATRFIGENGTDTDALPSAQQIAVDYQYTGSAASAGLTIAKLRRAAFIMNSAEVPMEDRYITYGAKQLDDMLATVEVTSREFNEVTALKDGKIPDNYFMGFKFVHTEQLPGNALTGNSTLYAWQKDGIKYADCGRDVYMDKLPSKRHALQLRGVSRMGAVRSENARVVSILCDNTL
jgi:hypothetical protein